MKFISFLNFFVDEKISRSFLLSLFLIALLISSSFNLAIVGLSSIASVAKSAFESHLPNLFITGKRKKQPRSATDSVLVTKALINNFPLSTNRFFSLYLKKLFLHAIDNNHKFTEITIHVSTSL